MKQKIFSLEKLKAILNKERKKGKKIVLCHGVFDLLHVGHIKHFKEAKTRGDILVVTITPDIYVNKGPSRPAFSEKLRTEAIASLSVVDYVSLNITSTATDVIKKIKPHVYCKGPDYKNNENDITKQIKKEIHEIKKINGKIFYTSGITFSSSELINEHHDSSSDLQKLLIKKIKKKYTFSNIKKLIEKFKSLKVLIIGETIIDKYVFCEALGKSGKEPMLVLRDIKTEQYLGGAAAISRHLSPFCNNIKLLSMIGEKSEHLKDIKKNLPNNVNFDYIKKNKSPTIEKKRFLDHINNNKVIGVYKINHEPLETKDENLFSKKLKKLLPNYDVVIVSDYGHGLISKKSANIICTNAKYLALNAQINAANLGYHSMRKYKNVDFFINNESEMRHEMRDIKSKPENLIKKLSREQNIKDLVVTRGKNGAIIYNKKFNKFGSCGAFVKTALDKVGAGDAMLSIISLCLKNNFTRELSLLMGSLAGAQSTEIFGNKETVSKNKMLKALQHILK